MSIVDMLRLFVQTLIKHLSDKYDMISVKIFQIKIKRKSVCVCVRNRSNALRFCTLFNLDLRHWHIFFVQKLIFDLLFKAFVKCV